MANKKIPEIINRQEADQLFKQINRRYIRGKRFYAICKLLLNTGVRVAELCNIKTKDIDMAGQVLKVKNGKGGRDRLIPFKEDIIPCLEDLINEKTVRGIESKYLFCAYSKGRKVKN